MVLDGTLKKLNKQLSNMRRKQLHGRNRTTLLIAREPENKFL